MSFKRDNVFPLLKVSQTRARVLKTSRSFKH
jgi:hypothetical protein